MYIKITYKQLSSKERDKIAILRIQGKSQGEIAYMTSRNKNTISIKLRRNLTPTYDICLPDERSGRQSAAPTSGKILLN